MSQDADASEPLIAGCPIVGTTWLEASGQAGSFVDPLSHLLMDDAAEKRLGFNLTTSYARAQHRLLLADKQALLSPSKPFDHVH